MAGKEGGTENVYSQNKYDGIFNRERFNLPKISIKLYKKNGLVMPDCNYCANRSKVSLNLAVYSSYEDAETNLPKRKEFQDI